MSVDENQKVNVIVELSTPAILHPKGAAVSNKAAASQQRNIFVNRILSISSTAKVLRQFSQVMNGVSLNAARSELAQIVSLPEVKRIYEDKKVSAFPVSSSMNIKPTSVQSDATLTTTGKGVKIGVIDTGVDYLHEALGGGFCPGFKVAGGYDFVNNKPDPLDDNGHGTHVA